MRKMFYYQLVSALLDGHLYLGPTLYVIKLLPDISTFRRGKVALKKPRVLG